MRILIVRTFPDILDLHSYNVQEIGLAKALVLRGHECDVVLYNGKEKDRSEKFIFENSGEKYSFHIYWCKGYAVFKNGFMPSVKNLIVNYDVVQVHEYDQLLSWQLYTRKYVPTVIYHGPYYHPYTKGYNFKCKVFDALFLRRSKYKDTLVLAKSELAADFIRGKGFRSVVPVGVGLNADNFQADNDDCKDIMKTTEECKTKLLYVGKIEERRNVYFLIEVFRKLRESHMDIQLILVGNGEKEYVGGFLKTITRELESSEIRYLPKASQKELANIYRNADIFIFTSNYEIFGMVLLEAMYFGLPIVSSENGGSSTLIKDGYNGYVLKEFHLAEWVDKLSGLINNKEKMQMMGNSAHATIVKEYTWERLAEKFEQVYLQAIEQFERK